MIGAPHAVVGIVCSCSLYLVLLLYAVVQPCLWPWHVLVCSGVVDNALYY